MSDDGKSLPGEAGGLRIELANLRHRLEMAEQEKEELRAANELLEEQNSILGNLAVAFHRLYSSTDYVQVVDIVKEIIVNLIGSNEFSIHVLDGNKGQPVLITREGKAGSTTAERDRVIAETTSTGELFMADEKMLRDKKKPVACIPLKLRGATMGTIVLDGLLVQKKRFGKQDREIFELLGNHASMALYLGKLNWIVAREVKLKLRDAIEDLTPPTTTSIKSIVSILSDKKPR